MGKNVWNQICKYKSHRELLKDILFVKKKYKNDLTILFLGKNQCSESQDPCDKTYQEGWEDGYKEGFGDGFSDDMIWVMFATEKLVKKGRIADKDILELIRTEIVGST